MEILLLGIYSFFVWLIFIKLKLLPWTTPWKVAVAIFPVVAIAIMLLLLNIFAPTTSDVRVVKYVVPIVSQVRGRVIEVPVENNRPVKKGDVLFRIDPTPYQNEVRSLEAKLASDEARIGAERQKMAEVQARLADAQTGEGQLNEQLKAATEQVNSLSASLDLARTRVKQNTELVAAGAGNRFDLEQAQTNVNELTAQLAAARAAERQVREKLSGRVKGDLASVAEVKAQIATAQAQVKAAQAQFETTQAQLENAKWDLTQTTVLAPGNGTMVNVMLRPGFFVAGMPFNEVMTFVDDEYQIFALFNQNELHQVVAGNEAEITLDTYPGRDHQGACRLDHLGAVAGTARRVRQPAANRLQPAARTVPGQARRRQGGQPAVSCCRRARGLGDLHRASHAGAHHPQGAAARVVVSRLRHHQAQHQRGALRPVMRHWLARHRSQLTARRSAALAALGLTLSAGCALKKPPDAAAIKEEALPGITLPAQWTATGAGAGLVADNWLVAFQRRPAERSRRRGDRAQR